MVHKFVVKEEISNIKIKDYLKNKHHFSSRYIKNIKVNGQVYINNNLSRMIDPVSKNDYIYIVSNEQLIDDNLNQRNLPQSTNASQTVNSLQHIDNKEKILDKNKYIISDAENYLIINKDGNLLSHDNYTGANASIQTILGERNLHLVNRLDRNTSGLMIIAKSSYYHHLFSLSTINKIYFLAVHGKIDQEHFFINFPIARSTNSIIERTCNENGKPSSSEFRTILYDSENDLSYLLCKIHTGRTHQIRVHSLYYGHPIVGDTLYGIDKLKEINTKQYRNLTKITSYEKRKELDEKVSRQCLHSYYLNFKLINSTQVEEYFAPLPKEILSILSKTKINKVDKKTSEAEKKQENKFYNNTSDINLHIKKISQELLPYFIERKD